MIILDTNVVSEALKSQPNKSVSTWLLQQRNSQLALTSVTAAELLYGTERLPHGERRRRLAASIAIILRNHAQRIFPFDILAAYEYADIVSHRTTVGRPIGRADAMIAAIARSHGMAVATRNVKDFEDTGIDIINPWDTATSETMMPEK